MNESVYPIGSNSRDLAGFCTLIAWLLGWSSAGWAGLGLSAIAAISYTWPDLKRSGFGTGWIFAGIRYLADWALFLGALVGGLRQKMLYLSATVD